MDMPTMKRVTVLRMCDVEGAEVQAEHAAAPLENADLECAGAGNATPQTDNTEKVLLSEKDALDLKELQNGATDAASDWVKPEEDECENAGKWSNKVDVNKAVKHQQQLDDQDVIRQKYKVCCCRIVLCMHIVTSCLPYFHISRWFFSSNMIVNYGENPTEADLRCISSI